MTALPGVSIVIPVYRGGAMFRACVAGVASLDPAPLEVIVVIDGEDDGSGALAESRLGARLVKTGQRSGPATARNLGAAAASGDVLLFLDADVVPNSALIAQLGEAFASDSDLAGLIGSYDDSPGHPAFLSQYRNLLHHYVHQTASAEAFTFCGACGAVRREIFERVGGFDAGIPEPAMEDIELGQRLIRDGQRIALRKDIQVKHMKPWGVRSLLRTDIFQRALPWARFLRRQGSLPNDLNLKHDARFSAVLAWCLVLAMGLAVIWPASLWLGLSAGIGLFMLNSGFYGFLMRKRGIVFALAALPWHWLYFLYASAAYAYVMVIERTRD